MSNLQLVIRISVIVIVFSYLEKGIHKAMRKKARNKKHLYTGSLVFDLEATSNRIEVKRSEYIHFKTALF